VTATPAASRRRVRAAAGDHPPRRPRAASRPFRRTVVTALTVAAAASAAVTGCAASGAPAAAPAPAGNVFTISKQVSLQQVQAEIRSLYSSHPSIASFAVQDVQYTTSSRDVVLRECTGDGAGSQNAETGQVIACAPLIFFLYSYGKQASVPAAVTVAGDLYRYAVTHLSGPLSVRTSLDELLQSWKLPVPGLSQAEQRNAVAASVLNAAGDSMLTQKSVHVVITDRAAGGALTQSIVADIGADTSTETITYGAATATIRITRQAAYFTGDAAGLRAYLGLSAAAAARVGSRWVVIKADQSEYQDLASENTIASLPSSILPSSASTTQLVSQTIGGQKAYVLAWQATASGSNAVISARLVLAATPQVLPVSETITTSSESKTVSFTRWGAPFAVAAPSATIPYAQVK
jgi:hypothetical protein